MGGMFLFLVAVSSAPAIPVEHKVVEVHMQTTQPPQLMQTKKKGKRSTLPFRSGTCSGAFITSNGDILTAKHCIDGYDQFEVVTYDRRIYAATVVATATVHDLALLHISRRNTPHFELADGTERGEKVYVLGSPLGITDTLTTGIVARVDGDQTLLDCGALPGNSGGPVFNRDNKLIGVLVAGYIVMMGTTHLNIAQGLDAVSDFLNKHADKIGR